MGDGVCFNVTEVFGVRRAITQRNVMTKQFTRFGGAQTAAAILEAQPLEHAI